MFEVDGDCMTDVKIRITAVTQRFGKMCHIWSDKPLHLNRRLRSYESNVYNVMTSGSE